MKVYEICDKWDGRSVVTFESQDEACEFMDDNGYDYFIHEVDVYKTYQDYRINKEEEE